MVRVTVLAALTSNENWFVYRALTGWMNIGGSAVTGSNAGAAPAGAAAGAGCCAATATLSSTCVDGNWYQVAWRPY